MATGYLFRGNIGRGVALTTHLHEAPSGPSWPVLGRPLPLLTIFKKDIGYCYHRNKPSHLTKTLLSSKSRSVWRLFLQTLSYKVPHDIRGSHELRGDNNLLIVYFVTKTLLKQRTEIFGAWVVALSSREIKGHFFFLAMGQTVKTRCQPVLRVNVTL
jgi:hypothetical protein